MELERPTQAELLAARDTLLKLARSIEMGEVKDAVTKRTPRDVKKPLDTGLMETAERLGRAESLHGHQGRRHAERERGPAGREHTEGDAAAQCARADVGRLRAAGGLLVNLYCYSISPIDWWVSVCSLARRASGNGNAA
jgi:hypothetical protein